MKTNTIITIGRQFGSGGREAGKMLAEQLDIPFYDRELIAMASEKSGVSKALFELVDEKAANAFTQSFAVTAFTPASRVSLPTEISINDKLFFAQADIIKSIANKGPCVIVGRCADYILRDRPEMVSIFLHADIETRTQRVAKMFDIEPEEARNTIVKTDKKRASYYNYYTNRVWSHVENYDLSVNSTKLGVGDTVKILRMFVEIKDGGKAE